MKKEKARQWQNEPLLLDAKDLQRILRINKNHIYRLFKQASFPSIQIGKRYVIEKNNFREWLNQQSRKNEFISSYKTLTPDEQKLYEKAFWEAVKFLKDREAEQHDRREKVAKLFSETG
ncbi:helix-turn-helix domain-containing protein [Halothermothrix orenii]|uniref:Helix-turn-helix domain-containing protein n=1 Tax=Halothermothrix orenii (strain H 168 / OCM 544 / DSM 9562) TaxID=373903 RepID=B8D1N0_HALOH|nr:helix-turn-helix domain-containing protein [Halothermothrix orenii]ACL69107.1 hypothetical protein Hore_03460 [Halothermothrix orenii H 168]